VEFYSNRSPFLSEVRRQPNPSCGKSIIIEAFTLQASSKLCDFFSFQYCVNVQIPKSLGGLGGQAVFVDTKLDFSAYRIEQMAEACVKRLEKLAPNSLDNFSKELVLDNIFLFEVTEDYAELFAVVLSLDGFIETHPNIKLIVVDSFSYLLRYELDSLERTRLANELMMNLHMLGRKYNLAVLLTHELTTRFDGSEEARAVPALGDGSKRKSAAF
jgi:RecA/RadA recombinase